MAEARLSSKDAGQSSVEAKRFSNGAGRSSKAAKRSPNGALRHAGAEFSDSEARALIRASNPTSGSRLASRTRSDGSEPNGALSRKISGWIVPNTDMRGASAPVSAGPACVPADLRANPRSIVAIPIPKGIARIPPCTKMPPLHATSSLACLPPATYVPRRVARKHADYGNNGSANCGKIRQKIVQTGRRYDGRRGPLRAFTSG